MAEAKGRKTQREKFIEKARELGCDEDEAAFKRTLRRILPKRDRKEKKAPKS